MSGSSMTCLYFAIFCSTVSSQDSPSITAAFQFGYWWAEYITVSSSDGFVIGFVNIIVVGLWPLCRSPAGPVSVVAFWMWWYWCWCLTSWGWSRSNKDLWAFDWRLLSAVLFWLPSHLPGWLGCFKTIVEERSSGLASQASLSWSPILSSIASSPLFSSSLLSPLSLPLSPSCLSGASVIHVCYGIGNLIEQSAKAGWYGYCPHVHISWSTKALWNGVCGLSGNSLIAQPWNSSISWFWEWLIRTNCWD